MIKNSVPAKSLAGRLNLPPDKSISHRSAMFAAVATGTSTIDNYSKAADPQSTLSCLQQLGVPVTKEGDRVIVEGVGRFGFKPPETPLDCGNSGTTMRLLGGIVAGAGVECELVGDASLSARTMKRIMTPLNEMGCSITGREDEFAPLRISAHRGVKGIRYPLPIASAQLKSAVLLAGLFGEKPTEVIESELSRDHTERLLDLKSESYGRGRVIRSSRKDEIPLQNYTVPADFSAAAFWLVAGTVHKKASIELPNVGMNPSRIAAFHILKEMGADLRRSNEKMQGREPVADISIKPSQLNPIRLDPALVPNCIDELPVLMVAMCFADGTSEISGAEELRHKETDRLDAMGEILKLAGASIELSKDGIVIHGSSSFRPKPARYPSYHDHRMAMAAAVMATRGSGVSEIMDADCTAISYPDFWTHLQNISH